MTIHSFSALLLFVLGTFIPHEGLTSETSQAQVVHFQLIAISKTREDSNPVKLAKMKEAFSQLSPSLNNIGLISTQDVRAIFMAAELVYNYALIYGDESTWRYMSSVDAAYQELKHRNAENHAETLDMLKLLVASRQWNKAQQLHSETSNKVQFAVPLLGASSDFERDEPAALFMSGSGNELLPRNIAIDSPYRIIVVSGCKTSDKAARSIESNPAVRAAFMKGGSIWLAPASKELDIPELLDWNRRFPRQQIAVAYDNSKWSGIDFSRIPTFYFYRKGRLVSTHRGWPRDGSIPLEIFDVLRRMDLL